MKPHVLVIDDDQEHREILSEALSYFHFKVKVSSSGKDLKKILKSFKPALLLIDYKLPGENGVELVKKMKQEFEMPEIPVILMSAYSLDSENLEECDYVLQKPFDLDNLIDHIHELLNSLKFAPPESNRNFDQDQVPD